MSGPKFPKPSVPLAVERHDRKVERKAHERTEKAAAKCRDRFRCRWPRCQYSAMKLVLDAAHIDASGMGGDPTGARMQRANLVTLCRIHHQGPRSLHSGHLEIEALTPDGANGALAFYDTDTEGRLYLVAQEDGQPFVYVRD